MVLDHKTQAVTKKETLLLIALFHNIRTSCTMFPMVWSFLQTFSSAELLSGKTARTKAT